MSCLILLTIPALSHMLSYLQAAVEWLQQPWSLLWKIHRKSKFWLTFELLLYSSSSSHFDEWLFFFMQWCHCIRERHNSFNWFVFHLSIVLQYWCAGITARLIACTLYFAHSLPKQADCPAQSPCNSHRWINRLQGQLTVMQYTQWRREWTNPSGCTGNYSQPNGCQKEHISKACVTQTPLMDY